MENLLAARAQMGMSLAFHIIFAVIGIALPLMMVIAEVLWLKTKDDTYLKLAKRWARGCAILFAVGAVSGTVLSFELGLLWPNFMRFSGAVIGLPFALEGFAFFTEAIFLGIYLYGWQKVSPLAHIFAGFVVAISGALSAVFVVIANAWMNSPRGFRLVNGWPQDIDPIAAMNNPYAFPETLHMVLASYAGVGFLVAGIHAIGLLRGKNKLFNQKALLIALALGGVCALLEPLSGDLLARMVAHNQPEKLAAFEALFKTQAGAPLTIGGVPDVKTATNHFAIEIPKALSFLIYHNFDGVVSGLDACPRSDWPNVIAVHFAFQIMVACGSIMPLVVLWAVFLFIRRKNIFDSKPFLFILSLCAPLGLIALECGWIVTEMGRQPWIIYKVMRTKEALTPMPGLLYTFSVFSLLYLFLLGVVAWLIWDLVADAVKTEQVVDGK